MRQQSFHQSIIDCTQAGDSRMNPKLMKHPHIRSTIAVIQTSKAPPLPLLRQQPHDCIEAMRWGEQRQKMRAPKLCGTEVVLGARMCLGCEQCIDELIGNITG